MGVVGWVGECVGVWGGMWANQGRQCENARKGGAGTCMEGHFGGVKGTVKCFCWLLAWGGGGGGGLYLLSLSPYYFLWGGNQVCIRRVLKPIQSLQPVALWKPPPPCEEIPMPDP